MPFLRPLIAASIVILTLVGCRWGEGDETSPSPETIQGDTSRKGEATDVSTLPAVAPTPPAEREQTQEVSPPPLPPVPPPKSCKEVLLPDAVATPDPTSPLIAPFVCGAGGTERCLPCALGTVCEEPRVIRIPLKGGTVVLDKSRGEKTPAMRLYDRGGNLFPFQWRRPLSVIWMNAAPDTPADARTSWDENLIFCGATGLTFIPPDASHPHPQIVIGYGGAVSQCSQKKVLVDLVVKHHSLALLNTRVVDQNLAPQPPPDPAAPYEISRLFLPTLQPLTAEVTQGNYEVDQGIFYNGQRGLALMPASPHVLTDSSFIDAFCSASTGLHCDSYLTLASGKGVAEVQSILRKRMHDAADSLGLPSTTLSDTACAASNILFTALRPDNRTVVAETAAKMGAQALLILSEGENGYPKYAGAYDIPADHFDNSSDKFCAVVDGVREHLRQQGIEPLLGLHMVSSLVRKELFDCKSGYGVYCGMEESIVRQPNGSPLVVAGNYYAAKVESPLMDKIAQGYARLFNQCHFDYLYMDAFEMGEPLTAGFPRGAVLKAKLGAKIIKAIGRSDILVQASSLNQFLWPAFTNHVTYDRALTDAYLHLDYVKLPHAQSNNRVRLMRSDFGWFGLFGELPAYGAPATQWQDITRLCARTVGFVGGVTMQLDVAPSCRDPDTRNCDPKVKPSLCENLLADGSLNGNSFDYRCNDLADAYLSYLRRCQAVRWEPLSDDLRARLRQPGKDFTLVARRGSASELLVPISYPTAASTPPFNQGASTAVDLAGTVLRGDGKGIWVCRQGARRSCQPDSTAAVMSDLSSTREAIEFTVQVPSEHLTGDEFVALEFVKPFLSAIDMRGALKMDLTVASLGGEKEPFVIGIQGRTFISDGVFPARGATFVFDVEEKTYQDAVFRTLPEGRRRWEHDLFTDGKITPIARVWPFDLEVEQSRFDPLTRVRALHFYISELGAGSHFRMRLLLSR